MITLNLKRILPFMETFICGNNVYNGEIDGKGIGIIGYNVISKELNPESKDRLKKLGYNIDELKINIIEFDYE